MNVTQAIADAGGIAAVAKLLNVPRTTVQYWSEQNKVPHWRQAELAKLVKAKPAKKARAA